MTNFGQKTVVISSITTKKYRVSLKTVPTFVLWISQLPWSLEIPSWTFFNSPFCVEFKNVHFYVIWLNLDRDIAKILGGSHFKS